MWTSNVLGRCGDAVSGDDRSWKKAPPESGAQDAVQRQLASATTAIRNEERRVGKTGRVMWGADTIRCPGRSAAGGVLFREASKQGGHTLMKKLQIAAFGAVGAML